MPRNPCKGIESAVGNIVGRLHVSKTPDEAADYVASRLKKDVPPAMVRKVKACARKLHEKNLDYYFRIMSGRLR